jgi:phosphatidylglycerol:prolipoprotein diacylglycerol transferase
MFYHNIDPVFLSLGPVQIRYYGLVYFLGFIITWMYLRKSKLLKNTFKKKEDVDDLIFYIFIGAILTARLFYVLFYGTQNYIQNPLEIFKLWQGGMSIHGGILGTVLGIIYFVKKNKDYTILQLTDLIAMPTAIALMFGRIANFINGELYGRVTSLPWAVKFKDAEGFRHPSQLYESAKNLIIFSILFLRSKKPFKEGELTALFLIYYSLLRFTVEFVREPEIYIGPLTMGQLLCIPMFIIGVWIKKKI